MGLSAKELSSVVPNRPQTFSTWLTLRPRAKYAGVSHRDRCCGCCALIPDEFSSEASPSSCGAKLGLSPNRIAVTSGRPKKSDS